MDERQALQAVIDRIKNEDSLRTLRNIAFDLLEIEERERRKMYLAPENWLANLTTQVDNESWLQELEAIDDEFDVK